MEPPGYAGVWGDSQGRRDMGGEELKGGASLRGIWNQWETRGQECAGEVNGVAGKLLRKSVAGAHFCF
jgi:hypothetical protein